MKAVPGALAAILLLSLTACGQSETRAAAATPAAAQPANPNSLSATQLVAAAKSIGIPLRSGGQVMNACGTSVTPKAYRAKVGGAAAPAWLYAVSGGSIKDSCYGKAEAAVWLLKESGTSFRILVNGFGRLALLPTEHDGVKDVAIGGPGLEASVYAWTGKAYKKQGQIKDSNMPPAIN